MDVHHIKFDLESSKENLLETILRNRENLNVEKISVAIKEFVQNYDKYTIEKKRVFETISNSA